MPVMRHKPRLEERSSIAFSHTEKKRKRVDVRQWGFKVFLSWPRKDDSPAKVKKIAGLVIRERTKFQDQVALETTNIKRRRVKRQ